MSVPLDASACVVQACVSAQSAQHLCSVSERCKGAAVAHKPLGYCMVLLSALSPSSDKQAGCMSREGCTFLGGLHKCSRVDWWHDAGGVHLADAGVLPHTAGR